MMMKKLIAVLLTLMLCAGMIPGMMITASAAEADVWDGTTASQAWESGTGTETDPYIIMTAAQLAKLAADINGGTSYAGIYFKLGADLDLNGNNHNWTPIGGYHSKSGSSATNAFAGVFDGNNKTISNLKSDGGTSAYAYAGYRGLFGHLTGTVMNLTLDAPYVQAGYQYVAGLVAYSNGGTVKNITVTNPTIKAAKFSSTRYGVSAIIGYMTNGSVVENCHVTGGTINTACPGAGAVAGYLNGTSIKNCTATNISITYTSSDNYIGSVVGAVLNGNVENCRATGCSITGTYSTNSFGGIVGYAEDAAVSYCTVKNATISVGAQCVGGIVGQIKYADGTNSITNCTVANSSITSSSNSVGGIVGYAYGNSAGVITVRLCSVTSGSVTASYRAGGIMGQSFYADIIGCCNYGSPVTATSNTGYAGGILGYYNIGNCYSCFSSAVITASQYPGAIIGRNQSNYYECAYDKTLYTTNLTYSNTKGFTTEEIKAGAAAYHLATTGTKTQNYHDWGQKIGTYLYPVWNTNNDASIVVHREEGPSGYIYYNEGAVDVFEPNADGYYEISDTETWYKFARKAEEDHTVKAIVVDDINFSDVSSDQLADYRIGDDYHFAGIFNGNGRIVSGLPKTGDPLFGTIGTDGKLTGLTVSGVTVSGGQYGSKAGLVQKNNGTIENCTISNVILTGSMGASLVFENYGTVTGCKAENVNINTTAASAGLVHSNYGSIENSTVSGMVKAVGTGNNDAWAGGICFITRGGTITGCTNSASVYAESAKDLASAAGIVAAPIRNDDNAIVTISGCVNIGNIEAKGGGSDYAAGISSIYETSAYAYISLSYNTGIITADTAAGIAAHMNTGSITNCYNAGPINARHTAGGISGNVCTVTNCHNYGKVTSEYYAAPICATGPDSWPQGRLTNTYGIENNIEAPEKNTFYDTSSGEWAEAVTAGSTKDQFENGEIAYLLQQANGNTQVWSQGENYPVFVSAENPVIVKVDFYTVIDGTASTETLATAYVNAGQTLGNKYPASPDAQYIVEGYYSDSSCTTKINTETYAPQSNTTIYVQLVDSHVHSWIYEAEDTNGDQVNDTITATCANTDNNCPTTDGGSVSIALPDSMEYTGSAIEAKVTDKLIPEHTVVYSDDGLMVGKPVNPGIYTATITLGSAEISVTYTITDVLNDITVTADPNGDVAIPTKGNTQNITLTATADYTYGEDADVTAATTWSLADTYNGVTIENNVITIAPEAAAGTISVKASYNGKEQTTVISLTKAGAGDLFVLGEILGADSVSVNGATEDQTATYAITGEDKYGALVTPAVEWSVAGMDGVTVDANGVLTVPKDAPTGEVTITATAESLSKTKTVSITAHEHNWTYAADGDTLTATCGNNEGCLSTNKELKIIYPALKVYGGTESKEATLSATSIGDIATLPAIQYEQKNGENWTALSDAPVIPGTYRASITVDTDKTASVEYTIDQATLTPSGTGIASGTYGAKLNELTVSGLTAMLNVTEVPGTWMLTGDTVPNVGDTESYTATFTPAANAAYYKPLTAQVTLNITPAQHAAPTAVVGSYAPNADKTKFVYTISAPVGTDYQYSTDGNTWQDSPIFDGFNAGDKATFYARVKADPNHTASDSVQSAEVTFEKLDQAAPALSYQVSDNSGDRTITITEVEGAEYSFDDGNTWDSSNELTGINDETIIVAIRMKKTAVYNASEKVAATPVIDVKLDETTLKLEAGDEKQMNATIVPATADNQTVTWASSDSSVAAVDQTGKVTAKSAGDATITVTTADGGLTASCTVHVHGWEYTAQGNTITASCACVENGGSVSIAVPDSLAYTGSPIVAKVDGELAAECTVVYSGNVLTDGKPVIPGEYTAAIKLGDAEISVTYTITNVLTGITVTADPAGDVPVPTKNNTQDIKLTAKASYEYGADADVTADATWKLNSTYSGVKLVNNVITIVPEAAAGTISVTASYGDKESTANIILTKDGANELFVLHDINGESEVSANGVTVDQTASYTITGEDKYGAPVTPSVEWSVSGMNGYVNIDANGKLTVSKDAPLGTVTITAAAGSLSKTKTVTITAHEHSWTYTANGNKITAVCGNSGCLSTNTELTISAPELEVYGGTGSKEATLSATSIGGIAVLPDIQYKEKNGENWNVLANALDVPGNYRASITVDTQIAYVEYTIKQATLTVEGTGVASGTYGAKLSELIVSGLTAKLNGTEVPGTWTLTGDKVPDVGDANSYTTAFTPAANAECYEPLTEQVTLSILPGKHEAPANITGAYAPNAEKTAFVYTVSDPVGNEYEYSKDGSTWQDSPIFDGFNADEKATFYARVKKDNNHEASEPVKSAEVTFEKLDQNAPVLNYQVNGHSGDRTITITEVEGAEYSFDDGNTWDSSNELTGINDETISIAIRMKETAVYNASEKVAASVNTAKAVQTVTFDTTERTVTYGDGTLEARAASAQGAITYESSDETVATVDDKGVVTIVGAGTATITAKAAETDTHAAAQASYSLTVNPKRLTAQGITLTLTESLYHYDGTAKTPVILLKDGNTDLVADQDYQVKDGSTITASAIGVYTITLTGKGNYTGDISEEWEITRIAAPAAPQNLQGIAPTTGLVDDGKIIGTTDEMEYATKADFSDAKNCGEGETINLTPGTYYVRLKGTDTTEPGATAIVNVPAYSAPVITFDANGGTVAIASVTTEQDGTLAELPAATRSGYTFDGWFTEQTGGTQVTVDTFFSVSTTIYAQWTYIPVPPIIDSPETDTIVEVYEGQTAQMTVVSQNATSYQWFINRNDDNGFVKYEGSVMAMHTTTEVKLDHDDYRYYCRITNADGNTDSPVFTLNVLRKPVIPQTGDEAQIGMWFVLMGLSFAGCMMILVQRKRREN